ncbi:response regulator [Dechloromonas sp. XY25]|uniref:histidine kinase n=1 Tax=Dechloromonas hankyongensis TaxID=2908002 RepID=A0ABS9JY31_9RHOO|nr:response regulator [Dechloromonas hankyongensis]MCG2575818.1 response regulator [Dechloromonas hankyongensis]
MLKSVSFKQPGFAKSLIPRIGLLILLALAAFTFGLYHLIGRPTVDRLAKTQMERAAEQLDARFGLLIKTVEVTLRSSQGWGKNGELDLSQVLRFNEFFFPIIANHGEITSVIFAHESGREILLLMTDDGRWLNRISNPAEWGNQTYWITWNAQREIEKVELRERNYDARERPWFKGAMALADERSVFWSEPYIFFTTKEPGITASMRWQATDGSQYVIAHDVRLIDIAEFTSRLAFSPQGKAALFLKEGRLIAPPRDPRFTSRQAINDALLKTADELALPELAAGFQKWQAEPHPVPGLHRHARPDGAWLSLFKPINGNTSGVWLGVTAPESDFVPVTGSDLLLLGLITLSALALGMAVAVRIANRFGEPLIALAEDSSRIGSLELDKPVTTDAPWREVAQLAAALESMRRHLASATQAAQDTNAELERKVASRTHALRQNQEILQKREAFFRAIFDNAAVGIISLDPERRPILINPAFARFLNLPIGDLLADPEKIALPADVLARLDDLVAHPDHSGPQSLRNEFEFIDPAGQSRWGDVQISTIRNADGELDSLLITLLDVSDRHEIQFELIRQFAFLQALLDTIPNPIFYKGADTRFRGCNQAYEAFFGVHRRNFIGKRVLDLDYLPAEARQAYQAEDEQVIANGGRISREVQLADADGTLHDTLYSVSGFSTPDGRPDGLIGVIVDISALKQAEREADRARAVAESAAAAKADFLANMSHEIRTPMNAIIGMTHLALQTELTARQKNYLSKVDNAAKGLLGIINDILDLSKIEAGMMHFEHAPFSLDDTLRHLSDMCALKARERGLELLYDIAPDVPDRLIGDPLRLGQILLNLVSNAIKFTEVGEIKVTLNALSSRDDGIELACEVIDTGIGMSAEQQERLFSAFAQADTSTTRKYGGTGLGLSICKRLVELQGGSIGVASQPGVGSRFTFRLPFGVATMQDPTPQRIGLPNDLRALVVDDSPGACEVFLHMLKMLDIAGQAVTSGPAALAELAKDGSYGLLIIDWKMPGMDGVELVERIRQNNLENTAAIVMATAYDHEELQAALGKHAVGAILNKPATPSSLFDSIMLALHRDPGNRPAPGLPAAAHSGLFAGQRVLLVEDNEVNRELAEEMLGNIGLRVDTAENGRLAVEKVEREAYDLVLMDCHMPVMDGYTASEAIRRLPGRASLPIVAMTANALASDRERCLAAGMNDHIPKPIDVAVLHATLARWLAGGDSLPVATPAASQEPPPLGIDTAAALSRLGGNRAMYQRLLLRFCDNQADAAEQLQANQASRDTDAMVLRAHTLRGLAGNIGAGNLARLAGELEDSLKQGLAANDPAIDAQLARLQSCLPAIVAQAGKLAAEAPAAATRPVDELSRHALADLQSLLANDDASAVRCFEEISDRLRQIFDPQLVDQLARQINQYDFDEARETLEQLPLQRHAI